MMGAQAGARHIHRIHHDEQSISDRRGADLDGAHGCECSWVIAGARAHALATYFSCLRLLHQRRFVGFLVSAPFPDFCGALESDVALSS